LIFSFVIPLALMTTYPALALLGRIDTKAALVSLCVATVFLVGSRWVWRRSLQHYSSAGG
jgi:ABC-2 type transport system permease protein